MDFFIKKLLKCNLNQFYLTLKEEFIQKEIRSHGQLVYLGKEIIEIMAKLHEHLRVRTIAQGVFCQTEIGR